MSDVVIVGPLFPAIGGIASIVSTLRAELKSHKNIYFINTAKRTNRLAAMFHPVSLVFFILWRCLFSRKSKVLIFSSAYRSFYEKCAWSFLVRLFGSQPYIVMVDGNFPDFYAPLSSRRKLFFRYMMKGVILAAQSQRWRVYYQGIFPASEVKVIRGGVDTDFFRPDYPLEQDNDKLRILYVGWIMVEKGVYDLLSGIKLFKENYKEFHLEMVGPIYEPIDRLQDSLNQNKLCGWVDLTGSIHDRKVLREKYSQADIFIFPSHFEGFPVALLEATSSGLACIGTDVGGIPDILDGCGIIIEKGSPLEISEALLSLANDSSRRLTMGRKSREKTLENYSLQKSLDSYMDLLSIKDGT